MSPSRRDFLRAAGACSGSVLLAACSGGDEPAQPPSPAALDPTPAPPVSPPDPPEMPPTPTPPPRVPPSAMTLALQDYLRTHAQPGFALPPGGGVPPSVQWAGQLRGDNTAATTLPNGTLFPVSHPFIGGAIRDRFAATLPGNPTIDGFPCLAVTRPYTCKGQPRNIASLNVLRIKTDAAVLELTGVVPEGSYAAQTLIVDGALMPPAVLSSGRATGGWNCGTIRIDFGSSAQRDVWLDTGLHIAYLRVAAGGTLFPADDSSEPQLTVIGDSYLQSRDAAFANGGALALEIGTRLGLRRISVDGIGGTGYWNSGVDVGNLGDRLPAHAGDRSAIYLVMAGINDYGDIVSPPRLVWPSRAEYEDAVTGYLRDLRAAQPDALIVVTAPFCPVPPMSDASYVAHVESNPSGLGDFLYKAAVQKAAVQDVAGPWVHIDVLMGGGWLNSSGASGDVTNLQWFTGGTPGPGTTPSHRPGNTRGGGGGAFGGIARVPVVSPGRYTQAPEARAIGGAGRGLLLSTSIDAAGAVTGVSVVTPGYDYTSGAGLPAIEIDSRFEIAPAVAGLPELIAPVNADGQYPLASFAPPGVDPAALNNVGSLLAADTIHPSPIGVAYLARRVAENIYAAVMAL